MPPIPLRGIAWNHSRGFASVVATAQRFEELHPGTSVTWEKRSLQAFADAPLEVLAETFDLIVMDHPHAAVAATGGLLLPLEDWLPAEFLADQAAHSVGLSHESYHFGDRQWSLATDAATPVAVWRSDLLERHGAARPADWEDLIALAGEGLVTVSAFPIDMLMHVYMMCDALGHQVPDESRLAPDTVLEEALAQLRRLTALCSPDCLGMNPIAVHEHMASAANQRAAYCPFMYGYSNYSRPLYADHVLHAGGLVRYGGRPLRSTLGGAGLAVSARTRRPEEATRYAAFTASPDVQRGIYFEAGGQPGHRKAWLDDTVNTASADFFRQTLETHDQALLRPCFPGYMDFQDAASPVAHACIAGLSSPSATARELNRLYQAAIASPS